MKVNKLKKPFFSVITVVKNDEKNIDKTIKSILNQSFKNFEYIVIDGNSVDRTLLKIKKYQKNIDHIVSENDKGIYFAMNKGAKLAKGKVVVFVNSGDIIKKKALSIIHKIFLKDHNISFVFGTVIRNYTKKTVLKYGFNKKKLNYNFDFATTHSVGFYLRSDIFKKLGFFNTNYKCSSDYDLYYKLIITHKKSGAHTKKNEIVGEVAQGGYSSKVSFIDHLFEEFKIRLDNNQNLFFILIIFINALMKHLFKKVF